MSKITLGWREWVALPELGIDRIKAKVDTGARTSCLHAFTYERFTRDGEEWIRFGVHPRQDNTNEELFCEAPLADERMVSDSGGHKELRPVIKTVIDLGQTSFEAELTLTNRDSMRFRMLLGRTAMEHRLIVDPAESYLLGESQEEV